MRHLSVLAMALGLLLTATGLRAQEKPILVANGDFAQGTQGWSVAQDETCKAEVVAGDVAEVKQALHLAINPKPGSEPWAITVMRPVEAALRSGTVVELRAWLRSPQSCRVTALVQHSREPYTQIANRQFKLSPEWKEYAIRGRCVEDYDPGGASAGFLVAFGPGEIEIAHVVLADLGPDAPGTVPTAPANPLDLIPWVLPWDDATPSVTDVSGWIEKPAGARGFVTVRDEHLHVGDRRLRIVGTNLTASAAFPEHADAEKVAARMAKFGINCVRFIGMDAEWTNGNIFGPDGRSINPQQIERLDYFVAQLKKHGIYTDLSLTGCHEYPGFARWEGVPEYFKGVDIFYRPMVRVQRDYARALLTHMNPYTKTRYVEEPAVAIIEINNENGLIGQWDWGGLDGMPPVYADELGRQWNAWLKARYPADEALRKA